MNPYDCIKESKMEETLIQTATRLGLSRECILHLIAVCHNTKGVEHLGDEKEIARQFLSTIEKWQREKAKDTGFPDDAAIPMHWYT